MTRLLGWMLSDEGWGTGVGDFEEYYHEQVAHLGRSRARWWYRRQVLGMLPERTHAKLSWKTSMLLNYLTLALRNMRKYRGYAFINVLGLALGLACCLVIFAFVRDQLSHDQYHVNGERIYRISTATTLLSSGATQEAATSSLLWPHVFERDFPEVETYARFVAPSSHQTPWTVTRGEDTFSETEFLVADPAALAMFSWPLVQGTRSAALQDPMSIVLSEPAARKYFGTASAIGKVLTVNVNDGQTPPFDLTVSGVVRVPSPSHFTFDFLIPALQLNQIFGGDATTGDGLDDWYWRAPIAHSYLLLRPDADPAAVTKKMAAFVEARIGEATTTRGYTVAPVLQRLDQLYLDGQRVNQLEPVGNVQQVTVFVIIALFILAIACINFINLSTARATQRAREVGVRKALGARREQVALQFLAESVLISIVAFTLALGLAWLALPQFYQYVGQTLALSHIATPGFLVGLLAFGMGVGAVAGGYPALVLARMAPIRALQGQGQRGRGGAWLRKSLVGVQYALSIVFIVASLTATRQIDYMRTTDLGYDQEQVLVLGPTTTNRLGDQLGALKAQLQQHASIEAVGLGSGLPGGFGGGNELYVERGRAATDGLSISEFSVDYDVLPLLGVEVVAGRLFDEAMGVDQAFQNEEGIYEYSAVVNEALVNAMGWGTSQEALGKQLVRDPNAMDLFANVVGVVSDFHMSSLHEPIQPQVIFLNPTPNYVAVKIQPGQTDAALAATQAALASVAPEVSFEYDFLSAHYNALYDTDRQVIEVFEYTTALAIFVACLGLFGLVAFSVQRRTKELGIRKVLGASVPGLLALIARDYAVLIGMAFVAAAPVAYVVMERLLDVYAYRVTQHLLTFALAGGVTLVLAILTVCAQAYRYAQANPIHSLRSE
ncbi:MAG: ABC transporter permease [Bacteroidota bacterium]